MASTTQGDYPLATVQFSRLTKRGVMLGLSLPQLVILAVAVLTVVAGLYTGGGMGLAWTSPVWGIATLLAVIPAGGRKLIEWVPIVARWTFRTYTALAGVSGLTVDETKSLLGQMTDVVMRGTMAALASRA